MRKLLITRGAQGAGKSTLLREVGLGGHTLCPDTIRRTLSSPIMTPLGEITTSQEQERRVWGQFRAYLTERMARGELLAVDEGSDAVGMAAVLLSAVMYAFNLVLQRMQALVARPLEIAFYQNTIVFLMMLVGVPFVVSWPASASQWAGAALAAGFAVGSLMLMSLAYRQAEAQRLVVIEYTAFIWAAILGWWFFAEPVTARTLLGTGLIVLGCLVSARGGSR